MSALRARVGVLAGAMAWPALTVALARSTAATAPALLDGTAGVDEALATVAALVGLTVLAWLGLVLAAAVLAALLPRGGRSGILAHRLGALITPISLRRLLTLAIAGAIVSGGSPAQAAGPSEHPPAATRVAAASDDLDPGWASAAVPTLPAASARPAVPVATAAVASRTPPAAAADSTAGGTALDPTWGGPERARPAVHPEDTVVVRRGDTLWDIAARQLGTAATDAEIARAWPHWFTANRATIGSDPDRLTPGQRLYPPASRAGGQP